MAAMTDNKSSQRQRKFWLQVAALFLIILPPIGLYYTVTLDMTWATWTLMGVIVTGMILTLCVT